jgi:hypothetical protein
MAQEECRPTGERELWAQFESRARFRFPLRRRAACTTSGTSIRAIASGIDPLWPG